MRRRTAALVGLVAVLGWRCGATGEGGRAGSTGRGTIVIGSKLDTEAQLLARLMAVQLKGQGYPVRTKIPLGGTGIVRKALTSKKIDVYWEFTGTGLNLVGQKPIGDPEAAYARVKELDAARGVTWLPAARLNDTYALAVRDGGPVGARSLSEFGAELRTEPAGRLCVDPEGGFRDDVLPRLRTAYGIVFQNTTQLDHDLVPAAVAAGRCVAGVVYSTTALIVKNGLRVLADDRRAFGAYTPAPTVLTRRLPRWPHLADDLAGLTAALDTPTITRLNARVDVDKKTPEEVARDFLVTRGLISAPAGNKGASGR
ncbi:MAG TPA: glycine betaine ABC transporter substrate-binding protein [Acidimicrobiia bacterium]|nr:glycine betaine ABC transporter substrate-binding protein [Acidimicrobiia bacterium]